MLRNLCLAMLLVSSLGAKAQDATKTDGDKYRVLLENEHVRVLEYRDLPGTTTRQHSHPAFVLYAMAPFKRKLLLPDGKVLMREFKAGDVIYSDEEKHIGENVGTTPTHVIMVEMKSVAKARDAKN
jgi:hypothetical protein